MNKKVFKIRIILAVLVLLALCIVIGPCFTQVLIVDSNSKDEIVSLKNKVSVLLPANWAREYWHDGYSLELYDYAFSLSPRANRLAEITIVNSLHPNTIKQTYERFFADPQTAAELYLKELERDHGPREHKPASDIIKNFQAEYKIINNTKVFYCTYIVIYSGSQEIFTQKAFYYHPKMSVMFRAACNNKPGSHLPDSYAQADSDKTKDKYEPIFNRVMESVKLPDTP